MYRTRFEARSAFAALVLATTAGLAHHARAQTAVQPPDAFAPCAACHTLDEQSGLGPSLKGVIGRKAGSASGFNYSRAMKNAAITWDEQTLNAFIAEPQKIVPGNHMPFSGLPEANDRASVVAFLKDLR